MSLVYDETKKLYNEILGIEKEYKQFIIDFLTEMGMRCMAKTKMRTPVDTGLLRSSWQLSDVYKKSNSEYYIVLFNPVYYASFVEYGHRQEVGRFVPQIGKRLVRPWVRGYFMATVSINEINREIPKRYDKALKEFLSTRNKYIK